MKVLAISGSPRRGGNTETLLRAVLEPIAAAGVETELVSLADHKVKGCTACTGCTRSETVRCVQPDPAFDGMVEKFMEADGILIGSPVYFGSATPEMMALLDRIGYVCRGNPKKLNFLRRKIGAAVAVARRTGCNFTFAQLNYFFLINEMLVPGSNYWNNGYAALPGTVVKDDEAMRVAQRLGENFLWLLQKTCER
ncbi:MAG: flavodoxin family protein [Thermoguttaceae bacterium]|nr:flavodoxin family protein [Thermoguttaceae bacterium]